MEILSQAWSEKQIDDSPKQIIDARRKCLHREVLHIHLILEVTEKQAHKDYKCNNCLNGVL